MELPPRMKATKTEMMESIETRYPELMTNTVAKLKRYRAEIMPMLPLK